MDLVDFDTITANVKQTLNQQVGQSGVPYAIYVFRLPQDHKLDTYTKRLKRLGCYVSCIKCRNRTIIMTVINQTDYSNFEEGEKSRRKGRSKNA